VRGAGGTPSPAESSARRPESAASAASAPLGSGPSFARDAAPVDPVVIAAQHGLAPLLLVTRSVATGGDSTHLVSSAGTLGWRPLLDRLYDDRVLGPRALRLRFLLDAVEHHCARAAECYAMSAAAARRTAALFGTRELTTLAGQTALFVELDALLSVVQRTYADGARLFAAAFPPRRARDAGAAPSRDAHPSHDPHAAVDALVLGARSAPPELREMLLAAWESHGVHARAYRRALRRRDAVELGHAPVQLARLACGVWAVSVPVPPPPGDGLDAAAGAHRRAPRRRVDALERAWAIATDAMRVISLVVYAASER
jgi:hypothetical protein